MERIPAQRRPHYPPIERMAILDAGKIVFKQVFEPPSGRFDTDVSVAILVQEAAGHDVEADMVQAIGHCVDGTVAEET